MRTEGSIEQHGLVDVLLALGHKARTGILTIQGRDEIIAFAFLNGGIVSADALNQAMEDGLGAALTELGLITESEFAALAAEYQSGGGQVVDLVVERGFVERSQLLDAVRSQTYRLCRQALAWSHGDFKFYRGEEVSYEEGVEPLSPEELLVRAGRDLKVELVPGGVPASDAVFSKGKGAEPSVEAGGPIGEAALATFQLIDGKRSVADLAAETGISEYRTAYLLSLWKRSGTIEESRRSRPKRAPAPTPPEPEAPAETAPAPSRPPRESWVKSWWAGRKEKAGAEPESVPWPSRILGLLLIAMFVGAFWAAPERVLLPFPWQRGLQEDFDRGRAVAALSRLRQANSSHFLLHGRFAEELSELEVGKLLPSSDLEDLDGQPLIYSATEASYVVRSSVSDVPERETFLQETIRGNFLLDPEVEQPSEARRQVLVLLD